jgi:ferredoxin-NADP reductase
MKARLASVRELAPRTYHFEFESDWPARFVPGQFLSFTRVINGDEVTRAYSIASQPDGPRFALCANLVEGGRFTPFLFSLAPGDEVDFTGPWGSFILRRPPSDSIFVATGTGIAPFRSMIPAALAGHPERKFTLIFGARYEEGLLYDAEFQTLAAGHPDFIYRPTLTRCGPDWKGCTGRVQAHVIEAVGERRDLDIYICGMREMVDDLRAQLKALGFDRKRIIYERYD